MRLTRRALIRDGSLAAIAACLAPHCPRITGEGLLEGIYTDKLTYRHGEPIHVHIALQSQVEVDLDIVRFDLPVPLRVLQARVPVSANQELLDPGIRGARFDVAASVSASDLSPGIYAAVISAESITSENRINSFNNFPSTNHRAWFVVTVNEPGSHSPILYLHDSLTAAAYDSWGGRSIYGSSGVKVPTVSFQRPGLTRAIDPLPAGFLRENDYELEFMDLIALNGAPFGLLEAYDLVLIFGQFEYVPYRVLAHLDRFLATGGNLFIASHEFATQRVRLDSFHGQMTAYKWDFEQSDPLMGLPEYHAHLAGVGMNIPGGFRETEIAGQTVWAAHRVTQGETIAMQIHRWAETDWLWDRTGLGDMLPKAFSWFASGNLLNWGGDRKPRILESRLTGTPQGTTVWATAPSADGRAWWLAGGRPVSEWPTFAGHATATYQERSSGSRVVTLPSWHMLTRHLDDPAYAQLSLNVMHELS